MKNTYLKTLVVACVATFSIIGLQNNWVEAYSEAKFEKEDNLLELGLQYGIDDIKPENIHQDDWITIEKKLQIPNNARAVANQSAKLEKELEKPVVSISKEEKDLFARLVEAEAKGESYEGKLAVATVVLNRVDSPEFPNTVPDVINQVVGSSYAFSPVQNGKISNPPTDEAKRAIDEALMREDRLNDSIYFYNPEIATDDWIRTRTVVKTIGNHVFAK